MNEDLNSIITEINSSLNQAARRYGAILIILFLNFVTFKSCYLKKFSQHGLLKLINFLENCSSDQERDLFSHHCGHWFKQMFHIFEVII